MANPSPEFWVNLITIILIGGAGGVGALLFFVLKGIRDNQTRIWEWAAQEVNKLHSEVRGTHDRHVKDNMDLRRYVRHEIRAMYGEILALAKIVGGKDGDDVAESIHSHLSKGDP